MASTVLGEQLREMFEKADDVLFDSAEKARNGSEQQLYIDTMRTVRMQRSKIMDAFRTSLRDALSRITADEAKSGEADDISKWSLMDREAVEEMIAVRNMETKATSLHSHELVELQRRLQRLADMTGGGLSPDAMSPVRIIRSFQSSIQGLDVDFPIKLVIFKLFDRLVVGRLSEVIVGANQLLARHGIEQKAGAAGDKVGKSRARTGGDPAPAWASGLNAAMLNQFIGTPGVAGALPADAAAANWSWAQGGSTGVPLPAGWPAAVAAGGGGGAPAPGYSDAALGHDISKVLATLAEGRWPQTPPWLSPANIALVARMFEGYYNDPRLTDKVKPMMGQMQLPVMKTALADPHFFKDPAHPARRAANDLFEILLQFSAAAGVAPQQAYDELGSLVQSMVKSFDLDPSKLQAAVQGNPVDDRTAGEFLREQEERLQQNNRSKVERVRRMVAHELRRRIGSRQPSKGVMRLMLSGFGPLLTLDYIRHGVEGESWKQTMDLVDRVLQSLEPQTGTSEERAGREAEIVTAISSRLANIGFSESKSQQVVSGLLQAYLDRAGQAPGSAHPSTGAPAAAATPSAATSSHAPAPGSDQELFQLLFIILVPGGWFTILDPASNVKYWVRVKSYYPTHNSVVLGHYMEERFLSLRATSFAADLVEGRAAVIDPSPELQRAIARVSEIQFERTTEPLIWTTVAGQSASAAV